MSGPGPAIPAAWWDDRRLLIAAVVLMALPLVWPHVPPLVDLPGHMGRFTVQQVLAGSPTLQAWYSFKWDLIGNLGIDLIVRALGPIIGVEWATKLVILTIPTLTAIGLLWIAREVHGQVPPTALFALPLAYGHPFHFGFINFALSMALGLVAFAYWLHLGTQNRLMLRAALFLPIGLLLWLCHAFGWAALCLMAFSAETVRAHDRLGGWWRPLWSAGLRCLVLAPPMLLMILWRSGSAAGSTGDMFNWVFKTMWLQMILRDRWQIFDIACLTILLIVVALALRSRSLAFSRHLGITALALLATFVLLPRVIFGSAYADMRLTPYMLAIAIIAIRPKAGADPRALSVIAMIALAFFTVRIGGTTASFYLFQQRHEQALAALEHVPRDARLFSVVGRNCGLPWYTNRMEHLPALALVRKHAFTNDQWQLAGAQLMYVKKAGDRRFVHDPSQVAPPKRCRFEPWIEMDRRLAILPRDAFDYVWIIDPVTPPKIPADFRLVWTNGVDRLYRIVREPAGDSGTS